MSQIPLACEDAVVIIPLSRILPTRKIDSALKHSPKYLCIAASVRELGLIEPLVVYPQSKPKGDYLLLDGHLRLEVLRDLEEKGARCLIAHDDEAFTYNHKVNRITPVQEHFMILRAIKNGVSEARIAKTLNVDVASIKQKRDLLEGICPEAVALLRDKRVTGSALREVRRARPMRQIEMAELMLSTRTYSQDYAKCLIAATPSEELVESERPKDLRGLSPEDIARMDHELETLGREFKIIEEAHGKNTLNLVVVLGYLRRLLDNARIARFLTQHYPELQSEFQKLLDSRAQLDAGVKE